MMSMQNVYRTFREMGKKVIYVTNNATKCRREYVQGPML
jgi:hypothetical protein